MARRPAGRARGQGGLEAATMARRSPGDAAAVPARIRTAVRMTGTARDAHASSGFSRPDVGSSRRIAGAADRSGRRRVHAPRGQGGRRAPKSPTRMRRDAEAVGTLTVEEWSGLARCCDRAASPARCSTPARTAEARIVAAAGSPGADDCHQHGRARTDIRLGDGNLDGAARVAALGGSTRSEPTVTKAAASIGSCAGGPAVRAIRASRGSSSA
jgi:hypothetical protein